MEIILVVTLTGRGSIPKYSNFLRWPLFFLWQRRHRRYSTSLLLLLYQHPAIRAPSVKLLLSYYQISLTNEKPHFSTLERFPRPGFLHFLFSFFVVSLQNFNLIHWKPQQFEAWHRNLLPQSACKKTCHAFEASFRDYQIQTWTSWKQLPVDRTSSCLSPNLSPRKRKRLYTVKKQEKMWLLYYKYLNVIDELNSIVNLTLKSPFLAKWEMESAQSIFEIL